MGYIVRPMSLEDIKQVSEIDREAFPTQWSPSFKQDINSRLAHYIVACEESEEASGDYLSDGRKASRGLSELASKVRRVFSRERSSGDKINQNIVGYAAMWLMVGEAHLTSIAVWEKYRHRGIGELLLISIINLSAEFNAQVITLEVRSSNLSAQALYEKYGFAKVGGRRSYYSDNGEDAVIMTTERIISASYQARFQRLKQAYAKRWGTHI